jgi:hypothetical protein
MVRLPRFHGILSCQSDAGKMVRELELERFGYRADAKDPAFFS